MSGRLITFSGVDCAGKSTQIHLLHNWFEKRGVRVRTLWFRPGYSKEMNALKAFSRLVVPRAIPGPENPVAREDIFARRGVARAWAYMAIADSFIQYALKLRALLLAGETVLTDRYLPDGVMDLKFKFPDLNVSDGAPLRVLAVLAPRAERAFLLKIPYSVMLERMAEKAEPFPDTAQVRDRRYAEYVRLGEAGLFEVVDANRPIHEVHAEIVGRLAL